MRKSKTIYVLLIVLAVLCIGAFAVSKIETHKENISNSGEVFLSVDPSAVTGLSWEVEDSEYSFTKEDGWVYDRDETFPVNEDKIEYLLEIFQDYSASFVIEDAEDLGEYGLDDPEGTITITTDSTTYSIVLGDYSTMDSQRYVSIGDGNVYLVSYDPTSDFTLDLNDLIQSDSIPYFETVQAISFTGNENYSVLYQEESTYSYCSDDIYFVGTKPLDTSNVSSYLSTISYLSLGDFVTYNADDASLETYFLSDPALSVTVNYTSTTADGTEEDGCFQLSVGCDEEALATAEEEEDTSAMVAYVRIGESPIIYAISADTYNELMSCSYNDLRHEEIVSADFDTIYQIDAVLEGKTYTICRDEEEEEKSDEDVAVWKYNDETIAIADLSSAITDLSADEFTTSAETGKQEIKLTLYLHNDNFPEIEVILYRYDGSECIAKVDGKITAFVPRSQVVDLTEAINSIILSK